LLLADGHDPDHAGLLVDVVQDAKAVVRAKADLPGGPERGRFLQGLAIRRLGAWLETQLLSNLLADKGVVFRVDGPQVFRDSRGEG